KVKASSLPSVVREKGYSLWVRRRQLEGTEGLEGRRSTLIYRKVTLYYAKVLPKIYLRFS
ncbi:hypothetical protein, partial [Desulfobotulus alkaliphilus]|uniref:hypothetical protein n=1 Tax=Desulfobotulus alkaliphilus TaxID=622671 RepID=UPI001C98A916